MNTQKRRIERLEEVRGLQAAVYAIGLADTDEVVVLSMKRSEEHQRMPCVVFEQRYPTAQIVESLSEAWMWDAL